MKLTRREFLKRLVLISAIPVIGGIDLKALRANVSDFSIEELENIKQIDKVEIQGYHPYFVAKPGQGNYEYVITKVDGTKEYYTDIRPLKKKYGNLIDYWNESTGDDLPDDIHNSRYDGDGWLL